MKFAEEDARYLERRRVLADRFGKQDIWSIVDQWPLYVGVMNLARYISISDLLRRTLAVPGHIAEFGVWRGATSMLLAKLLRIYDPHSPKVVHCFDSFQGLTEFTTPDGAAQTMTFQYRGDRERLESLAALYELDGALDIHAGLIEETLPRLLHDRPELMFSFVYCDTDLYNSTALILKTVPDRVMRGGLIVFDEWNEANWPGEGIAVNEFLASTGASFHVEAPSATRQPTLVLVKRS